MTDWEITDDDDDRIISLEDLRNREEDLDPQAQEDSNWEDSYDDMDSEAWEQHYQHEEENELERDPWSLD